MEVGRLVLHGAFVTHFVVTLLTPPAEDFRWHHDCQLPVVLISFLIISGEDLLILMDLTQGLLNALRGAKFLSKMINHFMGGEGLPKMELLNEEVSQKRKFLFWPEIKIAKKGH